MAKIRLDALLVERGLVESRAQAQRLIMAGQYGVNGQLALKPATSVADSAEVEIEKGLNCLARWRKTGSSAKSFPAQPGRMCVRRCRRINRWFHRLPAAKCATRVYAIDVGKGILHWKLRQDPRVW